MSKMFHSDLNRSPRQDVVCTNLTSSNASGRKRERELGLDRNTKTSQAATEEAKRNADSGIYLQYRYFAQSIEQLWVFEVIRFYLSSKSNMRFWEDVLCHRSKGVFAWGGAPTLRTMKSKREEHDKPL